MSLGKWESDPLLDVAGDAMTVTGATVTVKAESTGTNATLWQDEAGTIPLTNPFTVASTTILFYASPADRYRVDIVKDAYSRTLRHESVTMAAQEGISNLDVASALDGSEEFAVVQTTTKKSTISAIITYLRGLANIFTPVQHFTAGIGPHYVQNLGLTASVATKALTIALKTKALANASATDPVGIAFRNATLTTGDYAVRSATAATSVVVPSGATLGFTAAEDGLIYVYAIDNAGTVELAVAKKALFDESIVHSTTAISATADLDNVLYSTTARTSVAVRLVGRIRITTGAVAGEWDNAATRIEPWMPGMKKTGDVIQTRYGPNSAVTTSSTVMPLDNTRPQITEGVELVGSQTMAATSIINSIEIEFQVNISAGGAAHAVSAVFDGAADAIVSSFATVASSTNGEVMHNLYRYPAGSTASKTYSLRFGPGAAGTIYANGTGSSAILNSTLVSYLKISEIQA